MPPELVSVIIPAYNPGAMLRRSLDSVLAQTWRDFELIVVDDGSTDDTAAICAEYTERIRYIRQPNRGVSTARNHGLRLAQGVYVAFLDADDAWKPEFLSVLMGHLQAHPEVGAASSAWIEVTPDGRENVHPDPRGLTYDRVVDYLDVVRTGPHFVSANSAVYRRAAIARTGGFCAWLQHNEDTEFFIRFSLQALWYVTSAPLGYYYLHPQSATYGKDQAARIQAAVTPWALKHMPKSLEASGLSYRMYMRRKYARLCGSRLRYNQYRNLLHHVYLSAAKRARGGWEACQLLLWSAANGFSFRWPKIALWVVLRMCGLGPRHMAGFRKQAA